MTSKKKMIFEIPVELDEEFRKKVVERKGLHKGVIKEALEEAIQAWIDQERETKSDE